MSAAVLGSSLASMTLSCKLTSTEGLTARAAPMRAARMTVVSPECMVRIRFQRFGRKKAPFYRIVAIDRKDRRDGRPLEFLGFYDPLKKETQLNAPAIKKWIANGAQPTETVHNLLKKALIV
jgi:small subunit ribosomal protein S16